MNKILKDRGRRFRKGGLAEVDFVWYCSKDIS